MPNELEPSSEEKDLEQRVEKFMGSKPPIELSAPLLKAKKIPVQTLKDEEEPIESPLEDEQVEPPVEPEPELPKVPPTDNSDSLLEQIGATTDTEPVPSSIGESDETESSKNEAMMLSRTATPKPESVKIVETEDDAEKNAVTPFDDKSLSESFEPVVMDESWFAKFRNAFRHKWWWLLLILVILIGLLAWPTTRYKLLGYFIKTSVSVQVTDSTAHTPVEGATVSLDGVSTTTNADGQASLKAPPGAGIIRITKHYYDSYTMHEFIGLKAAPTITVKLIAAGRQVPITVINKFTGKPLAGVQINVLGTVARTGQNGMTEVVLPATPTQANAALTLSGYNPAKATIQVANSIVSTNTIGLVPVGAVYFLSNLSGTINVIKTNLDGSGRQTVLAGTGKENPTTTSLLATQDWRYLALQAQRTGNQPALYLIDTSSGKLTDIDASDATFTLIGWYDHTLLYDEVSSSVPAWQSGHEQIVSYNADLGQATVLDKNQAEGTASAYAEQSFSDITIVDGELVYATVWKVYGTTGGTISLGSSNDTIREITTVGLTKKDLQTVAAAQVSGVQSVMNAPNSVYFAFYGSSPSAVSYYQYENGAITSPTTLTAAAFNQSYPSYLIAPSNTQSFWSELQDGKTVLFLGDQNGAHQQALTSSGTYQPYGWFTDNYLLESKDGVLYIQPSGGLKSGQQPYTISTYDQLSQFYPDAQYSYGGF